MTVADPAILIRDFPISHALLAHDGLMTPKLTQFFGAVHARQSDLEDAGDSLVRWSTIYQTASGAPLLQAKLVIFKPALPDGFLDCLLSGTRLFGSLVVEAGVAVRMTGHRIFRADPPADPSGETGAGAWGRRHRMLRAGNDDPLCDVEERLEPEATLQDLILPAARNRLIRP